MPNFTLLGLSCIPLCKILKIMALLWPNHGPHMVLLIGSSGLLFNVPGDASCQISHCLVHSVAPFARNVQIMALLWPKYGPYMVLPICFS